MIEITRALVRQLRTVFQRAIGRTTRAHGGPLVFFHAGPEGLNIRAAGPDTLIGYQLAGNFEPTLFAVPLGLLAEFEGRRETAVCFDLLNPTRLRVSWHNGLVPRNKEFDLVHPPDQAFPPMPVNWLTAEPCLLAALQAAAETTDAMSSRFALGCLQLRGPARQIVATDGRQLLVQDGFAFPWPDDELLVPGLAVFGWRELRCDSRVRIGRSDKHVTLAAGAWTVQLTIDRDGRYPNVDDVVPAASAGTARLNLHPADAQFLLETIDRLPGEELLNYPVTLDLNRQIVVRARSEDEPRPTEIVLSNSRLDGQSLRLQTNRKYLARAARLGFCEFHFFGNAKPVLAQDEHRRYVWMCLDAGEVILPADGAVRIESPLATRRTSIRRRQSKAERGSICFPAVQSLCR